MMKVSKHSWHYRLWSLGRDSSSRPRNLCKYFWHIALIKVLFPLVVAFFVLLGVGLLLWVIWGHPIQTAAVILVALGIVLLGFGLFKLLQMWGERREEARYAASLVPTPPKPKKQPGVLRSFIKAKKQKACPLIEVVD